LQAECSLTRVLDRPLTGRIFFEEVIRENLDIGRPDHVQLVFELYWFSENGKFAFGALAWFQGLRRSPITL
jgi:hypothetical protein